MITASFAPSRRFGPPGGAAPIGRSRISREDAKESAHKTSSRSRVFTAHRRWATAMSPGLAVGFFEVAHAGDQRVASGGRERVVDARAHAADRTVPLEAGELALLRLCEEFLLQLLGRTAEADVHQRATVDARSAAEEGARVEVVVDDLGLGLVALGDSL